MQLSIKIQSVSQLRNIKYLSILQVDMYAGTIFIQQAVGWDLYTGVLVLLAISAIYTISGNIIIHTKLKYCSNFL